MTIRDRVIAWMTGQPKPETVEKRDASLSWQAYQNLFSFNGTQYVAGLGAYQSATARSLLTTCGPVHTVLDRRASILGEARPMFQRFSSGRPTDLFSNRDLAILEQPWPGGTWRELATICESDVAAYGNSYWIRLRDPIARIDQLARLEPDWVTIVTEQVEVRGSDIGSRLIGYAVKKPGYDDVAVFEPGEVAHYRPGTSCGSPWRGESWLAAVAIDASSDVELTRYKGNYLRNGAMPSLAVLYDPAIDDEQLEAFVPLFNEKFTGSLNAGKVMHLLGGRDVKTVGATLDQLAYKAVQGGGETRIASAAGVPAVVAGFSEGMQGSSLNAGNYVATRRLFADAKMRPLLGSLVEALGNVVVVPGGCRLWYDDSQVSFFQEDVKDDADIRQANASTINTLLIAGFEPDAAVDAVLSGDFRRLSGKHTGLFSVQLQPPQTAVPPAAQPIGGGNGQSQN